MPVGSGYVFLSRQESNSSVQPKSVLMFREAVSGAEASCFLYLRMHEVILCESHSQCNVVFEWPD